MPLSPEDIQRLLQQLSGGIGPSGMLGPAIPLGPIGSTGMGGAVASLPGLGAAGGGLGAAGAGATTPAAAGWTALSNLSAPTNSLVSRYNALPKVARGLAPLALGQVGSSLASSLPGSSPLESSLKGAATGAGIGAAAGSFIPGLGTLAGGVGGGLIGAAVPVLSQLFGFGGGGEESESAGISTWEDLEALAPELGLTPQDLAPIRQQYLVQSLLAESDEEKEVAFQSARQLFEQVAIGKATQSSSPLPEFQQPSAADIAALQLLAANLMEPVAQAEEQAGSQHAAILNELAGSASTPAFANAFREQAAARGQGSKSISAAYRAQAQVLPSFAAMQKQQSYLDQISNQLFSQAFANVNPYNQQVGQADDISALLSQALMGQ